MSEVNCPHCNAEIDVGRLDLRSADGESAETECRDCGRMVVIAVSVSVSHTAYCLDGEHDLVVSDRHPEMQSCTRCHYFAAVAGDSRREAANGR